MRGSRKWHPTPVFLPGESQGRWSLVGCRLWGRTELDATDANLAAAAWAGTLQTATDPTLPSVMPTLPRATHHLAGPAGMSVWKYMELTHYILKAQHNSCLVGRTLICWLCLVHERITCSAWKTIGVSGLSLRGDGWSLSDGPLFGTLWAAAHQAPLPMEFSRQEYWSG